jgi:hypothetical protein
MEVVMRVLPSTLLMVCCCTSVGAGAEQDVRVLATAKTSTMEKEMNEAAEAGFRFAAVMGGDTAFGGSEVVVVMTRTEDQARVQYRLLATGKTSTMEKELQQTGDAGFEYRGQTVFKSTFGGKEVAVILERDKSIAPERYRYQVLATSKTSTMEKELRDATAAGYEFVGMTVGKTLIGGEEVLSILRKRAE